MEKRRGRDWLSWAVVALLAVLCGLLGALQNRWIAQVGQAERDRLQLRLKTGLSELSRDFNAQLTAACASLMPSEYEVERLGRERAYSAKYLLWKESHDHVFSRIVLVVPEDGALGFFQLDPDTAHFSRREWPAGWAGMQSLLLAHLEDGGFPSDTPYDSMLIDLPRFGNSQGRADGGRHERDWLIVELNAAYVRDTMLLELLRQHLGAGGKLDYQIKVVASSDPSNVIMDSAPDPNYGFTGDPEAAVNLFDVNYPALRRLSLGDRAREHFQREPAPSESQGRWRMLARHRERSLDSMVYRARWQNLVSSLGILLLILATGVALVRSSRRARDLAEQQMNFVAGVSHELRTPLAVIRTAGFNLQGLLSTRPEQVARYGKLIEDESENLGRLVEQILRYNRARSGQPLDRSEPVAIEAIIDEGIRSSLALMPGQNIVIEKQVEQDLPPVLADQLGLQHAIRNLIENALKYGTESSNWIGIYAALVRDEQGAAVEIRIADRGPGIPADEQQHIFDPFFRGRRALRDQIHGTGLGLNLVKTIVEAHGGSIRVWTEPMKGAEFVLRIPAASVEVADEFAHTAG